MHTRSLRARVSRSISFIVWASRCPPALARVPVRGIRALAHDSSGGLFAGFALSPTTRAGAPCGFRALPTTRAGRCSLSFVCKSPKRRARSRVSAVGPVDGRTRALRLHGHPQVRPRHPTLCTALARARGRGAPCVTANRGRRANRTHATLHAWRPTASMRWSVAIRAQRHGMVPRRRRAPPTRLRTRSPRSTASFDAAERRRWNASCPFSHTEIRRYAAGPPRTHSCSCRNAASRCSRSSRRVHPVPSEQTHR